MESTNKGEYLGLCNLSSCKTQKPATFYNHGSLKYYCEDCAEMLSNDSVNHRDAMRLFGHRLCTKGERVDSDRDFNPILIEGDPAKLVTEMSMVGRKSMVLGTIGVSDYAEIKTKEDLVKDAEPWIDRGLEFKITNPYKDGYSITGISDKYTKNRPHNNRKIKKRKKAKNGKR